MGWPTRTSAADQEIRPTQRSVERASRPAFGLLAELFLSDGFRFAHFSTPRMLINFAARENSVDDYLTGLNRKQNPQSPDSDLPLGSTVH
jgi:hypothetical protein